MKISHAATLAICIGSYFVIGCDNPHHSKLGESTRPSNENELEEVLSGRQLYAAKCARCHRSIDNSSKRGRTVDQISRALQSIGQMSSIQATEEEVLRISQALGGTPVEDPIDPPVASAPHIEILSPPNGSQVHERINVSGSCTDGISITLSGDVISQNLICNSGSFSTEVFLSSGLGTKMVRASQSNEGGSRVSSITLVRIEDTGGAIDTDNDGIPDNVDLDDDNDGVPDLSDHYPLDPSRQFNGAVAYSSRCVDCHGILEISNRKSSRPIPEIASQIVFAIENVPQMGGFQGMDSREINAIAEALYDPEIGREVFVIEQPSQDSSLAGEFEVSGTCISGAQVQIRISDQVFTTMTCQGTFSSLISIDDAGQQNEALEISVSQVISDQTETLLRNIFYTSIGDLNETFVDNELSNSCQTSGEDLSPTPLKRLTKTQYINSLRMLLGELDFPQFYEANINLFRSLPEERYTDGITAYMRFSRLGGNSTQDHVRQYNEIATEIGEFYTSAGQNRSRRLFGQCYNGDSTSVTCAHQFIDRFGRLTFSRPILAIERADARQIFSSATTASEGFRLVTYYFLMSPQFHFQMDIEGSVPSQNTTTLSPYEIVNKISLSFANMRADSYLLDLAASGGVSTPSQKQQVVDYLLTYYSAFAREALWEFVGEWLGKKNPRFIGYTEALDGVIEDLFDLSSQGENFGNSLHNELRRMFEYYVFDNPSNYSTLLTNEKSFANEPLLASVYNVAIVPNGEQSVDHRPQQRRGFLTTAELLVSGSGSNNPFRVGGRIHKHILCREFGDLDPPMDLGEVHETDVLQTTREHYESLIPQGSSCVGCHQQLNPLGFPFEQFDAIGRYRGNSERIFDSQGNFLGQLQTNTVTTVRLSGQEIGVANSLDLIHRIDQSKEAHACFARQYLRFSMRRKDTQADSCTVERMYQTLKTGTVLDMIRNMVSDPNFSKRKLN